MKARKSSSAARPRAGYKDLQREELEARNNYVALSERDPRRDAAWDRLRTAEQALKNARRAAFAKGRARVAEEKRVLSETSTFAGVTFVPVEHTPPYTHKAYWPGAARPIWIRRGDLPSEELAKTVVAGNYK